jgi:hypothetical protein
MNAPETTLPILLREDSAGVATLTLNRPASSIRCRRNC